MAKRLSEDLEQSTGSELQSEQTENLDTTTQGEGSEGEGGNGEGSETPDTASIESKNKEEKPKSRASKKETTETEIPASIAKVLKAYPQYEVLYVDNKGGIFSPKTPEKIRGNAVAYSNPHFTK